MGSTDCERTHCHIPIISASYPAAICALARGTASCSHRPVKRRFLLFLLMASAAMAPTRPDGAYFGGAPLSAQHMNAVSPSDQYDVPPKFIRGRAPLNRALPLTERERQPSAVIIEFT